MKKSLRIYLFKPPQKFYPGVSENTAALWLKLELLLALLCKTSVKTVLGAEHFK